MRPGLAGRVFAVVFVFVAVVAIPCRAQTASAAVAGQITDPNGRVVPGAEVTLTNLNTNVASPTKTNGDGIYRVSGLQPGIYRVNVTKDGFKSIVKGDIELHVQDNVSINFSLEIGSVSETVTVEAGTSMINTTDGAVSTVVDRQFFDNIPLNGRSFEDLLTLVPGVLQVFGGSGGSNGEMTVNGQRTEANYFTVDGASATVGPPSTFGAQIFGTGAGLGGATPSETALGTTQSLASVDSLQEFRASTSTYSAEYGRTPGGQFAFTTRSGTNGWHGSAYDYFRNEALDANNWFLDQEDEPKERERQNDFGGTLGGPIVVPGVYNGTGKTFFFFSYEGLRLWTPEGLETSAVPDQAFRETAPAALQPLLNAFPLQSKDKNGNPIEDGLNDGFGFYEARISYPSTIDSVSVRIDHDFGSKVRLFGRYASTPSSDAAFVGAVTNSFDYNDRLLTVGTTIAMGARQTNELRFNITQSDVATDEFSGNIGGATPFNGSSLPGPNGKPLGPNILFCLCYGDVASLQLEVSRNSQRQYNIVDTHSWTVGSHELKFGVDWRRLSTYMVPQPTSVDAVFYSETSVLSGIMDNATVNVTAPAPARPIYKNFSLFAEDEWKVTPHLSLSLGLRWDVNPAPTNAAGPSPYTVNQITDPATVQLAPAGTPLWHTEWRAFAPRIGLAYQLRQTPGHETVIRTGFGKFFDMGNATGSTGFEGVGFMGMANFFNVPFPLTSAQVTLPPPSVTPPYSADVVGYDPHLRLPYTLQWNFAIQQSLGNKNALTVTYLGSAGRGLLSTFQYGPADLGNPNFDNNLCYHCLFITKNEGSSDYDALQVQFQRQLSHGLQALASYTWSHSIDNSTTNFLLEELVRGNSDFDVRHNFQAALTYDIPGRYSSRVLSSILGGWGVDTRISARSGLPVDIAGTFDLDPETGTFVSYHPDIVPGQPMYVSAPGRPGGKVLNYNAWVALPAGEEGNSGRNSARSFGAWQANLALRRDIPIRESLHLEFRAEAFNILNHPSFGALWGQLQFGSCNGQPLTDGFCFGTPYQTLNSALGGGNGLYSTGGPRSIQFALKLKF
ncbi:MAG TPA: TonB-dependent receptor [Candidatus Aquilonibacter sp.]|nr:TonB-dependent receptor [Candidatus Aquilonibacter sp.]